MSLIHYSIKNNIGGVSRQAPSLRQQSQCEEMVNCLPSPADFLKRRPGTSHIAKMFDSLPDGAFIDFIIRGENEAGVLAITGGKVHVFKLDGTKVGEAANPYLECTSPKDDLRLMTINDRNFILNTKRKVSCPVENVNEERDSAFIFIKQAAFSTIYMVEFNGFPLHYMTLDYNTSFNTLSAEKIATYFAERINKYSEEVGPAFFPEIKAVTSGAIIKLTGIITSLAVSDSAGNEYIKSFHKKTASLTDLPVYAPNGAKLEITGEPSTLSDNFYVVFIADNNMDIGNGYWKETAKHTERRFIDAATMPHNIDVSPRGIKVEPFNWAERKAGDDETCPCPAFDGEQINDIFLYRNRLCFITGDAISMSETGIFFNFFNVTATTLLATDPINVFIGGIKTAKLKYALIYNSGLLIYSDKTLFNVTHGDELSIYTFSAAPMLQFDTNLSARPVVSDTSIYYCSSNSGYTSIREYRPESSSDMYAYSSELTPHIPGYIPNGAYRIVPSYEEGLLFVFAGNENIYVYSSYKNTAGIKAQSAWGRWQFGGKVLCGEAINGILYLIIAYRDGVFLEKINLAQHADYIADRYGFSSNELEMKSLYEYSEQFLHADPSSSVTAGALRLRTMAVRYEDSGAFRIVIARKGRKTETLEFRYDKSGEARFPILTDSRDVKIRLESCGTQPFRITETRFEAVYAARSKQI